MSYIKRVTGLLTEEDCISLIEWAKHPAVRRYAETPQPSIHPVTSFDSPGLMKVKSSLKNYSNAMGFDIYDSLPKVAVTCYRITDRLYWHPDYRPDDCDLKASVSVILRQGNQVLEYIERIGIARFDGGVGDAIFFPGFVAHRVIPHFVDRGERWVLTAWVHGPRFK